MHGTCCSPVAVTSPRPRFSARSQKPTHPTGPSSSLPSAPSPSCSPSSWVAVCCGAVYATATERPWCLVSGSLRPRSWLGTLLVSCSTPPPSWPSSVPQVSWRSGSGLTGVAWFVRGRNSASARQRTVFLEHAKPSGAPRSSPPCSWS